MTAPQPAPQPKPEPRMVAWGSCERCGAAGLASELDDRFCVTCLPDPETQRRQVAVVQRRVHLAKHAAARESPYAGEAPVAPDAEHIWLVTRGPMPHLFLDDEASSYCGRAWLGRRASVDVDTPAPEDSRACRQCWRVYRAGRRGPETALRAP